MQFKKKFIAMVCMFFSTNHILMCMEERISQASSQTNLERMNSIPLSDDGKNIGQLPTKTPGVDRGDMLKIGNVFKSDTNHGVANRYHSNDSDVSDWTCSFLWGCFSHISSCCTCRSSCCDEDENLYHAQYK